MDRAKGADRINKAVKQVAYVGVLAALAFGLSWLEMLLPSIGIPGAKLGVANLAVLAALYLCSPAEAALVSLVRIILSWLLFGSFTGLIYSLCGGALSLAVDDNPEKVKPLFACRSQRGGRSFSQYRAAFGGIYHDGQGSFGISSGSFAVRSDLWDGYRNRREIDYRKIGQGKVILWIYFQEPSFLSVLMGWRG